MNDSKLWDVKNNSTNISSMQSEKFSLSSLYKFITQDGTFICNKCQSQFSNKSFILKHVISCK
jgi:hypothetical protein